jgi:hypothetical protein
MGTVRIQRDPLGKSRGRELGSSGIPRPHLFQRKAKQMRGGLLPFNQAMLLISGCSV